MDDEHETDPELILEFLRRVANRNYPRHTGGHLLINTALGPVILTIPAGGGERPGPVPSQPAASPVAEPVQAGDGETDFCPAPDSVRARREKRKRLDKMLGNAK